MAAKNSEMDEQTQIVPEESKEEKNAHQVWLTSGPDEESCGFILVTPIEGLTDALYGENNGPHSTFKNDYLSFSICLSSSPQKILKKNWMKISSGGV